MREFDSLWASHDGVHFYKNEWKEFLKVAFAKVAESARQQGRDDAVEHIKRMNLWSKGTVEGTRNDIIAKIEARTTPNN